MRRSPLLPIFLIVLVDVFGFTLVIPLLPLYAEKFGATATEATLLFSTYAACQFLAGPVLGDLSDRRGRKPVLLLSQIGTCLGFLVMARAQALWVLFLARVIDGVTAGNLTTAQAYIADNTLPENRAKSFALIGIAFGVGFLVGPALSGFLGAAYGLNTPIYLAAALSLGSVLCTAFLLPNEAAPPAEAQAAGVDRAARSADAPSASGAAGPAGRRVSAFAFGTYKEYLARPVLGGLLLQFFFFSFAFSTFNSGFALFATERLTWEGHPFGIKQIGVLLGYGAFVGMIIQGGLIGRLVKRFGEAALVAAGFAAMAIGYAGLGAVLPGAILPLVLVTTIASFGNAVLRPSLTSLVTQRVAKTEQGIVLGVNQSMVSVAQILAPALAGPLLPLRIAGLSAWAGVASLAAAIGLVAGRWGSARMRKGQKESAASA